MFGHQELPVLVGRDRPPERVSRRDVSHRLVERRLGESDARGGDADPAAGQGRQRLLEPVALDFAEESVCAELDLVEVHIGGQLAAVSHLQVRYADPDAWQTRVDDEHRQAVAGPGERHDEAGNGRVRDPPFAATEDPAVAAAFGDGLHGLRAQVGRRLGLGGGEGADQLSGHEGPQTTFLLLRGCVEQGVAGQDAVHVEDRGDAARVVGELLDGDSGGGHRVVESPPSDLAAESHTEQPVGCHCVEDITQESFNALVAVRDPGSRWGHDLIGELARPAADIVHFLGREQIVEQ